MKSLFVLAVSALLCGEALADTIVKQAPVAALVPGEMLASACESSDPTTHCDTYIAGVVDSITANGMVFEGNKICLPAEIPIEKFRGLVAKYIRSHPEFPPDSIAASEVVTVLTEQYPCPNEEAPEHHR